MIYKKNGFLKLYSSDFLLQGLVLLLFVFRFGGDSQATGTSEQVVAMLGDDAVLPCYLEPARDAAALTLEWAKSDLDPKFVLLRRGGVELQHAKHPMFTGRSSLSMERLKCGDVSLKLSEVKLPDSGTYRCLVPTTKTDSEIQLTVGSISSPIIYFSVESNGVSLDCKSKGWYPEPEVLWLDDEGRVFPAKPAETLRGPDGLYTVSSRLTVEKRISNTFTCRVHQRNISQTRETHIQVPAELFMDQSSSAVRVIICVVVSIVPVVAVILVVRKWEKNKKTAMNHERQTKTTLGNSLEHQLLEGRRDREQSMMVTERIKYLDSTKVKLEEELERTEEELKHVEESITTLMGQRKVLRIQKEKLISLQQNDKVKIEEIEKILKQKIRKFNNDKMEFEQHLKKREEEHDELIKTTEKLLESTDAMINKMTERKGNLQKDKEQIKKYLKETQRQLEVSERKQAEEKPQTEEPEV